MTSAGKTVWDSGKTTSNATVNIALSGAELASDTDYTWSITWYDSQDVASQPAFGAFSTGLMATTDWAGAEFIAGSPSMLRSEFVVNGSPTRARLYIIGLGYYKSYLNGESTDEHVLGNGHLLMYSPGIQRP